MIQIKVLKKLFLVCFVICRTPDLYFPEHAHYLCQRLRLIDDGTVVINNVTASGIRANDLWSKHCHGITSPKLCPHLFLQT